MTYQHLTDNELIAILITEEDRLLYKIVQRSTVQLFNVKLWNGIN